MSDPNLRGRISIWTPDGIHHKWAILIREPRCPYLCSIQSINWRKYGSRKGAKRAAMRTAKRLGVRIEGESAG